MANFNSMVLTEKGQILYAKGQAGATINFTKMAVGIGAIGSTDPTTLTDLVSHKFDIAIQGKTVNTLEKVALIGGTLTNENMTETVYLQEIGLYAQDPDEGEILYSYASAGQFGDSTSPASNGPYAWNYQVYAAIGNAANVTVTLSNLQYDTGLVNTNTTFSIIKGSNQKEINKSIDNKFKPYLTTNSGNVYTITSNDIDTLTDGYPILVRFNADSTEDISVIINGSSAYDVVDYFNNKVTNVRNGLVAKLVFDANNSNFQLLGKGGEGDATEEQILEGKKVTVNSGPLVGTMVNNNVPSTNLSINATYTIPRGFHPGTEVVTQNIQTKTAATYNPSTSEQTIASGQYLNEPQTITATTGTATVDDVVAGKTFNSASGIGLIGIATIASLGGAQVASGSFYRNLSTVTVALPFTPNVIITMSTDGNIVNIRQTILPWYYSDVLFLHNPSWAAYTSSIQAGNDGNPCIAIGTDNFTWQAMGGSGETIDYLALKI